MIVSAALPPLACGEAMSTYFTAVKLAETGIDVHVVTTARRRIVDLPGVTVHAEIGAWTWWELPKLLRLLRRIDPDAVLLIYMPAMYERHPMVTMLPSFVRRVLPRARFVTRFEHVSGAAEPVELDWRTRFARRVAGMLVAPRRADARLGSLASDSDAIITLCREHDDELRRDAPEVASKTKVIPPAANLAIAADPRGEHRARGRERIVASDRDLVVGYFGYVYPDKGIETLLRAVASARRRAELRLVLLGGRIGAPGSEFFAYFDRMQELAGTLGLSARATWSGGFEHDDEDTVPAYFHAVDFWALPFVGGAQLNNSSLTSLLTHGRAIVTTRGPVIDDALVNEDNLLLVPPGDVQALADAIDRLAERPALRDRLAEGALALARHRLTWPAMIQQTLSTLVEPR